MSETVIEYSLSGVTIRVDAVDEELLHMYRWRLLRRTNNLTYVVRVGKKTEPVKTVFLHRQVMGRVIGRTLFSGEMVDHINHDGTDNSRINLRIATAGQNSANARLSKTNKSGFKGVSYNKARNKWWAFLGDDYLGLFPTPEEAHAAYCAAAREKYGEFANFGVVQHG